MTTAGETERQVEALLFAASAPLGAAEIAARLPEIAGSLHADNWAAAGRAIMTTDTFPKGAYAEADALLDAVGAAGVSYQDVVDVLETEGLEKFEAAWDELLGSVRSGLDAHR